MQMQVLHGELHRGLPVLQDSSLPAEAPGKDVPVPPPRPGLAFGDTVAQFPPAVRVLGTKTAPSWGNHESFMGCQAGPRWC